MMPSTHRPEFPEKTRQIFRNPHPLLLETFVQSDRFVGTSYRAANWIHVGQTQGRGKLDVHNQHALPKKDIWLYPLRRDFRRRLCAPLDPHPNQ